VLESVEPIPEGEAKAAECTDGRRRIALLDGSSVPVRPQMAGANLGTAYYIVKTLGLVPPGLSPRGEVMWTGEVLTDLGYVTCAHHGCAACAGHLQVRRNVVEFGKDKRFIARKRLLLPQGVFDQDLHNEMMAQAAAQLAQETEGPVLQDFLDAARYRGGERAISVLLNDKRGYEGHVEGGIARVRVSGYAINERTFALLTGGRINTEAPSQYVAGGDEVFGQNDVEAWQLAVDLARYLYQGQSRMDSATLERAALMAGEDWASGVHGTVARDIPTWVIGFVPDSKRYVRPSGDSLPVDSSVGGLVLSNSVLFSR
jgi:hypothetical protein